MFSRTRRTTPTSAKSRRICKTSRSYRTRERVCPQWSSTRDHGASGGRQPRTWIAVSRWTRQVPRTRASAWSTRPCSPSPRPSPQIPTVGSPFKPYNAELFVYKPWGQKSYFQFEIIINVLVISFRFIWIPVLCVYSHYKYVYSYSGVSTLDVRIWRLQTSDSDTKIDPHTVRVKPSRCIKASFFHLWRMT